MNPPNPLAFLTWIGALGYVIATGVVTERVASVALAVMLAVVVPLAVSGWFLVRHRILLPALLWGVAGLALLLLGIVGLGFVYLPILLLPLVATAVEQSKRGPLVGGTAVVGLWTMGLVGVFSVAFFEYPASTPQDVAIPAVIAGVIALAGGSIGTAIAMLRVAGIRSRSSEESASPQARQPGQLAEPGLDDDL